MRLRSLVLLVAFAAFAAFAASLVAGAQSGSHHHNHSHEHGEPQHQNATHGHEAHQQAHEALADDAQHASLNDSAQDAAPSAAQRAVVFAVAGMGVGGLVALGVAWLRRPPLWLLPLYTRLRDSRVLEHPLRRRMHEAVRASPGVPLAQLQRATGASNGELEHHLRVLERARHVRVVADGRLRRVYPADAPTPTRRDGLREQAMAELAARGPMTAAELARRLDVSRQALHYHVRRLVADGCIEARQEGRDLRLMLPELRH